MASMLDSMSSPFLASALSGSLCLATAVMIVTLLVADQVVTSLASGPPTAAVCNNTLHYTVNFYKPQGPRQTTTQ